MEDVYGALHRAVAAEVGARLFTVSAFDPVAQVARRVYTSHPAEYPVTGIKPVLPDAWSRHVLDGRQSFVANDTAGFAPYFPDHALINSLGCASALNVPVVDGDRVVGTVNLLDREGHFTPARVAAAEALVARHRDALARAIGAALRDGG